MKKSLFLLFFLLFSIQIFAADISLEKDDSYVEFISGEEGFHLYVRNKPDIGSILITESSADPEKRVDSFALRAYDYNPVNGDELRILNGEFIDQDKELYFLVDSTPEENPYFPEGAYHIFIPFHLTFGYEWSRQGQLEFTRGTWINIRTFENPYTDYSGEYLDTAYTLQMKELPEPTVIAAPPIGEIHNLDDPELLIDEIDDIISQAGGELDLVLVIDTTISMKDNISFIQEDLVPLVRTKTATFENLRIGIVLYRDYKEAYLTKEYDFVENLDRVQEILNYIKVSGGRDIEEAVYEGMYSAIIHFDWTAENRMIIQVGDAPPHPEPIGEITREMVMEAAEESNISIYPIMLPNENY